MVKIEFFEELKKLTQGNIQSIDCKIIASDAFYYLKEFGFEVEECTDFNGWQCDYWYSAVYRNIKYLVSGGAWYGNFEIRLADDEECDEGGDY